MQSWPKLPLPLFDLWCAVPLTQLEEVSDRAARLLSEALRMLDGVSVSAAECKRVSPSLMAKTCVVRSRV